MPGAPHFTQAGMNRKPADGTEQPVPHVLTRVWQRQDEVALEHFTLQGLAGQFFMSGQITFVIDDAPGFLTYTVACDESWRTQEAHVHMSSAGHTFLTRLLRRENGAWQVSGEDRPDLQDATDVDVQWTPSTNALPINRLRLILVKPRESTQHGSGSRRCAWSGYLRGIRG